MAKKKTKTIEALDPRAVRADGKGMTKDQRAARERELSNETFTALTALTEAQANEGKRRIEALKLGLSATAIKRAQKRAKEMAEDFPPGHIEAMAAVDSFEETCADYGIDARDVDMIWGAVAQICMYQLATQRGPFHQAAENFGLVKPRSIAAVLQDFTARDLAARRGPCDCPNCRPRKDSELN